MKILNQARFAAIASILFMVTPLYAFAESPGSLEEFAGIIRAKKVAKIEVVAIAKTRFSNIAFSSVDVESNPDYRIFVESGGVDSTARSLADALSATAVRTDISPMGEVRMGVILYDVRSKRIGDLFISSDGSYAVVNSKKIFLDTSFFKPSLSSWFRNFIVGKY